jgi:hypothetical protein
MICHSPGCIVHAKTVGGSASREVHIFEPKWVEAFVEAADLLPDIAANHKKRTCGLVDRLFHVVVVAEATELPIYRVVRPHPIETECLKYQRG